MWDPFSFIFSSNSHLLLVETVHSSTWTYFSANPSFRLVETSFLSTGNSIVLFRVFSATRNYYWNLGEVKFQRQNIFLLVNTSFINIFRDFKIFSTSTKFSLNKKTLEIKSVSTRRNEQHLTENQNRKNLVYT